MSKINKRKIILVSLATATIASGITAGVYLYYRDILKHLIIENKLDLVNNIIDIPYSASAFKEKWEQEGLNFDSPIFKKYFNHKLNFQNNNKLIKTFKLNTVISKDNNKLILTITVSKKFGKKEIKQFTLEGFNKEIYEFARSLNINISNRNKLASQITNNDLYATTLANEDKYKIEYELIPNDISGKLKIITTITSLQNPTLKTLVEKIISGFKKDQIDDNAILQYTAKEELLNLLDVSLIESSINNLENDALINKLKEYGTFDDSKLNGLKWNLISIKTYNSTNIEELEFKYILLKEVIVGKENANLIKKVISKEKTLKVSYAKIIRKSYFKQIKDYVQYLQNQFLNQKGFEKDKLASKFNFDNDLFINKLDSKYFLMEFEDIKKSDINRNISGKLKISTKLLKKQIVANTDVILKMFLEDLPFKQLNVVPKNDNKITNLNEYLENEKYKEIIESIAYPIDNGWTLIPASIAVSIDPNNNKNLVFKYKVQKQVLLDSTNNAMKLIEKDKEIKVSYANIIHENKEREWNNFQKNIVIEYDGEKPRIDKIDNTKLTIKYKALHNPNNFPHYEILGIDTVYQYKNFNTGKMWIRAKVKDNRDNSVLYTNPQLIEGFKKFEITEDDLLKGMPRSDISNFYNMKDILKLFPTISNPYNVWNKLQELLNDFKMPQVLPLHEVEILDLRSKGNKLVLKYKIRVKADMATFGGDNSWECLEKEDTKEFDFINVFSENMKKLLESLTIKLSDEILNNKIENIMASEVNKDISAFSIYSNIVNTFNTNDYDWKVETNPNDVNGKLFAKITMISKTDPNIKFSKIVNDLTDAKQFKTYQVGVIQNVGIKYNFDANSPADIVNKITNTVNSTEEAKKYLSFSTNNGEKISFVKDISHYNISNNTIKFKYLIWKHLKAPNNFEDITTNNDVQEYKEFTLNYDDIFNDFIYKKLIEISKSICCDITDRPNKLASSIKKEDINEINFNSLPEDYIIDFYWLNPNDEEGKLKIYAKIKHTSGKYHIYSKIFNDFKKITNLSYTHENNTTNSNLNNEYQTLIGKYNSAQTNNEKLEIAKKFFIFKGLEDQNVECISLALSGKKVTFKFKYTWKIITSRNENGQEFGHTYVSDLDAERDFN